MLVKPYASLQPPAGTCAASILKSVEYELYQHLFRGKALSAFCPWLMSLNKVIIIALVGIAKPA